MHQNKQTDTTMEFELTKQQRRNSRQRPRHESEITSEYGKQQPQDLEIEEVVLGALMLERNAYSIVCDILTPESFYDNANAKIYEAIQALGASQRPIDMLTVTE